MHFQKKNIVSRFFAAGILGISFTLLSPLSHATSITLLNANHHTNIPQEKINQIISHDFNISQYAEIKAQVIENTQHAPDHILIYLLHKNDHGVTIARVNIDYQYNPLSIVNNYKLTTEDYEQQPGKKASEAQCENTSIEFIAFAPNQNTLEQEITSDVANAAKAHGLKTIRLLLNDATRQNYLNYMTCPHLKGNFYDGDANPDLILTADGVISEKEIKTILANKFNYKVTNIWLACEAYQDPMLSTMLNVAQAQKYAAGMNDLLIGPSDRTAACAMKAAFDGKPMTSSFQTCYDQFDTVDDQWGFSGYGSDYFGS